MNILKWLRPKPIKEYVYVPEVKVVTRHTVDPQMGKRQLDLIRSKVDRKKYSIGDPLELVAYKQGQADLFNYIETQLFGGKL